MNMVGVSSAAQSLNAFGVEASKRASAAVQRRLSRGDATVSRMPGCALFNAMKTLSHPFIANAINVVWTKSFIFLSILSVFSTLAFIPLTVCVVWSFALGFIYRFIVMTRSHANMLPIPINQYGVFLTGCSSAVGFETAQRLALLGFTVFATVRRQEDADKLTAAFKERAAMESGIGHDVGHGTIVPLLCEISRLEDVKRCVAYITDYFDKRMAKDARMLAVINNASHGEYGPIELLSPEQLRHQFEVNTISYVAISQAFLPLLRRDNTKPTASRPERNSRLIFVSSGLAEFTMGGTGAYSASKHALNAIADAFRIELRQWKIDVICIEPGLTRHLPKTNPAQVVKQLAFLSRITALKNLMVARYGNPASLVADVIQIAVLDDKPIPKMLAGVDVANMPWMLHLPLQFIDWMVSTEHMMKH